jgi:cytochrome c
MTQIATIRRAASMLTLLCAPALAQDPPGESSEAGQILFNNACRTCHTVTEGDNRLGPHLHGVVGRQAGALPGYAYSAAMAGSGIVWDAANLDRFIENPEAVVPGNNMKPYTGLASPEERARLIEFLGKAG